MWAGGLLCLQAAVGLLIGHERWLWRQDFAHVAVDHGRHPFTGQAMASVDFVAAVAALDSGVLPCSSGERAMLRIAASIAEGIAVDLRDALTDLDEVNTALIVRAVAEAAGHDRAGVGGELR